MKASKTNLSILGGLFLVLILSMGNLAKPLNADPNFNIRIVDVTVLQQQFTTEISDKLKGEFKDKHSELQKELGSFKDDQEKFQKNAATMSKDQVAAQANTLASKQAELQQKVAQFDQQLETRRQEELQVKYEKLISVVRDISTKEKYDMVLAKAAALYIDDKYDITTTVVTNYNKKK